MNASQPIGIFFRSDAYSETTELRPRQPVSKSVAGGEANRPQGLMGREVASQSFLRALLRYGNWSMLEAILQSEADRAALTSLCSECLGKSSQPRHVHLTLQNELDRWLLSPTASVLNFPYPPESNFAKARAACDGEGPRVAFSGMTHTLCSKHAIDALWQFLNGPWYPFDRLVCTSQSVVDMVRATIDAMRIYLIKRDGAAPDLQIGLELIPLGVDTELHRPATPAQRHEARRRLGISHDRLALLFVGRLSHHSKSQPFATFQAAQHAAERLGSDVVLIQCGWYSNSAVREAYEGTARQVAPNVRLVHVDGLDPWWRTHVWDAADVFVSLADSIQETFGLTVIEAMAHGLPVIASDWNGYRDTVRHDVTGLLTPTYMISGSLDRVAEQFVASEITYDQFLAVTSQATVVDVTAASEQFAQLACNASLRDQLGSASRARACSHFAWPVIIARYEAMWQQQREELNRYRKSARSHSRTQNMEATSLSPMYPPIESGFRGYPTTWLEPERRYRKRGDVRHLKSTLLDRLRNHSVSWSSDIEHTISVFDALPTEFSVSTLSSGFHHSAPDFIAWLLKYDLVVVDEQRALPQHATSQAWVTFVTTCMGRLADLKVTLPILASQPRAEVIVVDFSCPDRVGDWVAETFSAERFAHVKVVRVEGETRFDRSRAKNAGAFAARTPWVCLIDADIVPIRDFSERLRALAEPNSICRSDVIVDGTGGTFLFERALFDAVGGHDSLFQGWGEQDEDLVDALRFAGAELKSFPADWLQHRDHDDQARTGHHAITDRRETQLRNRLYRAAKWDWARVLNRPLSETECKLLRSRVEEALHRATTAGSPDVADVTVDLGTAHWPHLGRSCVRELRYRVSAFEERQ